MPTGRLFVREIRELKDSHQKQHTNMNGNINYSVIIPHRNTPNLLQRCINSIPKRNDIQIIVIDDNSDTNIVDFKNFPGLDNPFVEIELTKEGKGAGYARNIGLKRAFGKWLLFADADDFFTESIDYILNFYKDSDAEIIYFKVNSVDSESFMPSLRNKDWNDLLDPEKTDKLRYMHMVPWGKIIRKDLIDRENIIFDEVPFSNDVMFATKIGHFANEIKISDEILYTVTARKGSLFFLQTKDTLFCRYEVFLRRNAFLKSVDKTDYMTPIAPTILNIGKELGIGSVYKAIKLARIYRINIFLNKRSNIFIAILIHFFRRKKKNELAKYEVKH